MELQDQYVRTKTLSDLYSEFEDTNLKSKLELYALWTIPSVFPEESASYNKTGNAEIKHDYQSIGARLVNTLTSKLTATLFPYSTSFFRINASQEVQAVINQNSNNSVAKATLAQIEGLANKALFYNASYAQLCQLVRLLIITGNGLLVRRDKKCTVYSLKNYVLKRNGKGEVEQIIIRECVKPQDLPKDVHSKVFNDLSDGYGLGDDTHYLYTSVRHKYTKVGNRDIPSWHVTQELNNVALDTDETYTEYDCPYVPVVWSLMNGDNYGRGYVEEYTGSFTRLSELSQRYTEYELEALKVLHVYNPAKNFDMYELQNSKSGDYVQGDPTALSVYEIGMYQKLQQVAADLTGLTKELEVAFMSQGNSRDAERVTAYEIRMNAEEADKLLGGVYSQLSLSLHLPLAYLLLNETDSSLVAAVMKGQLDINLIVGLQALSSSAENQALLIAVQQIAAATQTFGALNQLSLRYNIDTIVDKILTGNGIDPESLIYTQQQIQKIQDAKMAELQAQQAQQQQQLASQGVDIAQGSQQQQQQAINMAQGVM